MKHSMFAAVILGWLVGTGCQTTVNTVQPAQPSAQVRELITKKIITDPSLNRRVRVVNAIASTGPTGFLTVQLDVQNVSQAAQRYTYRVEWFDENGILITSPAAGAIPRIIEGGEIQSIVVTAPTQQARDFRIKLQEPTN